MDGVGDQVDPVVRCAGEYEAFEGGPWRRRWRSSKENAGGIGTCVMERAVGWDSDGRVGTEEPCFVATRPEGAESRALVNSVISSVDMSASTGGTSS